MPMSTFAGDPPSSPTSWVAATRSRSRSASSLSFFYIFLLFLFVRVVVIVESIAFIVGGRRVDVFVGGAPDLIVFFRNLPVAIICHGVLLVWTSFGRDASKANTIALGSFDGGIA